MGADDPVGPFDISANDLLLGLLRTADGVGALPAFDVVVIEQVRSYGMAVGAEVFDTVHWSGRFHEAALPLPVVLLPRQAVKLALCHDSRAKDANIRAALIDRYGGPAAIRKGGALFGVHGDVWAALAVAVTYADSVA